MIEKTLTLCIKALLVIRYRITVVGLDQIDRDKRILFMPNHPAMIDPIILMTLLLPKFRVRPLADQAQLKIPLVSPIIKRVNPIRLPDVMKEGINAHQAAIEAITSVVDALQADENILFYPAGHLTRTHNEKIAGNSGVAMILEKVPDVQFVLIRTRGLWGSSFGWGRGKAPRLFGKVGFYLKCIAANLLVFVPKRKVLIEFVTDKTLANLGNRKEINDYLESFYNKKPVTNTHVPYFFWQGSKPITLPEPITESFSGELGNVPEEIQKLVISHLKERTGIETFHLEDNLAADLGLDSLSRVEIGHWLTHEFGVEVETMEGIDTVGKMILAANGQILGSQNAQIKAIPPQWFVKTSSAGLAVPTGKTIPEIFLHHARTQPDAVIIADQLAGAKTWRNMVTAILVLRPAIQKIQADYVGIMLPASVSATIVYFAVLFSGKIPVMINWTVGESNLRHSLGTVGLTHILTASALLEKLKQQGSDYTGLPVTWVELDKLAAKISKFRKLGALFKSYVSWRELYNQPIQNTAAVLFTSGSESKPKTVPLTHDNFLSNLIDYNTFFTFLANDRILGMLPPFHSFGLVGGTILPVCMGMQVVYHANPTEGAVLSQLIARYQPTILIGTPTFVNGILVGGRKGDLDSLRLLITGAEKCPMELYTTMAQRYPNALVIEGYGITECSPVVSANRPENPMPGTIGHMMPSLEYLIVDPDSFVPVEQGTRGRLIVRGQSVFSGYRNYEGVSPFVRVNGKEWYDTTDLVVEDTLGNLTFCGRLKRFIKIGGEMISLPAIDEVLAHAFSATNDKGEPLFAVHSTASETHPEILLFSVNKIDRLAANQAIKEAGLSPLYSIRRVIQLDAIPILGTGKTDYQTLNKLKTD